MATLNGRETLASISQKARGTVDNYSLEQLRQQVHAVTDAHPINWQHSLLKQALASPTFQPNSNLARLRTKTRPDEITTLTELEDPLLNYAHALGLVTNQSIDPQNRIVVVNLTREPEYPRFLLIAASQRQLSMGTGSSIPLTEEICADILYNHALKLLEQPLDTHFDTTRELIY